MTVTVTKGSVAFNQRFVKNNIAGSDGVQRVSGTGSATVYDDTGSGKVTVWTGGRYVVQAEGAYPSDAGATKRNQTMGREIAARLAS